VITSPLLSNIRYRAMISPVSPLLTVVSFILARVAGQLTYCSFEIILETGTVHWIGFQIQCPVQIHCFKKHSVRCDLCFKKYL